MIIGIVGCEESSLDVQNSEVKGNSGSDTIGELVFAIGRDCVEVGGPLSQKCWSQQPPTRRPYSPGPSHHQLTGFSHNIQDTPLQYQQ